MIDIRHYVSIDQTVHTDESLDRAGVEFPVHLGLGYVVTLAVVTLSHVAAVWTWDNNE